VNCPSCTKEVIADRLFCSWCESYIPNPPLGKKASLVRRGVANALDLVLLPGLFIVLVAGGVAAQSNAFASILAFALWLAVFIASLVLFTRGMTIGKWLLSEQVVEKLGGGPPGFLRMFLRETIAKWISSLFFGFGFFWAIWDKDSQAWHDKIVGTVVVKRAARGPAPAPASASPASSSRWTPPSVALPPVPAPGWSPPPLAAPTPTPLAHVSSSLSPTADTATDRPGALPVIASADHAGNGLARDPADDLAQKYGPPLRVLTGEDHDATTVRLAPAPAPVYRAPAPPPVPARARIPALDEAPRPRSSAPPVRRRSRVGIIAAALVLVVVAAAAAAGYWWWAHPQVVFRNGLDAPVQVTLRGAPPQTVEPKSVFATRVPRDGGLQLEWVAQRVDRSLPMGTRLSGRAARPFDADPRVPARVRAAASMDGNAYFEPRITNETGRPIRIEVNGGLRDPSGASMAAACDCLVPPGVSRFPIGYYRLFHNSTVRATDAGGATAVFENVAGSVDRVSGTVGLRFSARDLRRP